MDVADCLKVNCLCPNAYLQFGAGATKGIVWEQHINRPRRSPVTPKDPISASLRISRIEDARRGDEDAMAQLMEEAWPAVFRHLRSLGVPEQDTADLVQESLIRGMTRLSGYHAEKSDFHTWLCAIAKNAWIDVLRKRKRETLADPFDREAEDTFSEAFHMAPPEESFPDLDLRDALARLPDDVRFAVLMRYVHGLTNKAVGKLLGIPEGTVKSKIHYGLGKMRKGLGAHA